MPRNRNLLLILSLILATLVLVAVYGPNPEADAAALSEDEIAEWTVPSQDTGAIVESWELLSLYLIVPADTDDPCADYYVIDLLMPQDACAEPPMTEEPTYY